MPLRRVRAQKPHCSPASNRAHRSRLAPPDSRCPALLEPQLALIIIICCRQGLADRRLRLPTDASAFAKVSTSRVPTPMTMLFSASCNVVSVHLTTRGSPPASGSQCYKHNPAQVDIRAQRQLSDHDEDSEGDGSSDAE